MEKLFELLGVSYKTKHQRIIMFYSSFFNKPIKNMVKKHIISNKKYLQLGLGVIATGILGSERIITAQELDEDLSFVKENKIKTAVIFSLSGLNEEYMKIIKKYNQTD
jgi:hypothetical protein